MSSSKKNLKKRIENKVFNFLMDGFREMYETVNNLTDEQMTQSFQILPNFGSTA